jgi:1-aminocyclopropane-1-carboxylate deaminase/D-cysteine desulfhydrase-like pyridoxal-dependent ACC family enzyme
MWGYDGLSLPYILYQAWLIMSRATQLQAAIDRLPRVALGVHPTPLEALPRLTTALATAPLYIKRDDLTGLAFGGNKTRMLEFSLADALAKGADTIVTGMAVQSNYCRQMAAACAKLGLDLHLVLRPVRPVDRKDVQGNHLLQRLFGAHIEVLTDDDRARQKVAIAATAARLKRAGRHVYIPRQEETIDLDVIAYAETAREIVQQCAELDIAPHTLYLAAADTTQAGIVLGLKFLDSPIRVRGINPSAAGPEPRAAMLALASRAAARLGLEVALRDEDFDNDITFVGERYGIPTAAGLAAVHLVARQEGILLDPVYTGKAMAALIADAEEGKLDGPAPVLFLHTGGAPALFGYADDLLASMPK